MIIVEGIRRRSKKLVGGGWVDGWCEMEGGRPAMARDISTMNGSSLFAALSREDHMTPYVPPFSVPFIVPFIVRS
jgi:hypothetical protein